MVYAFCRPSMVLHNLYRHLIITRVDFSIVLTHLPMHEDAVVR